MTTAGDEPHRPGFVAGLVIDLGFACSSLLRTRAWTITVLATWALVLGAVLASSMLLVAQTLPGWLMRSSGLVSIRSREAGGNLGSIPAGRAALTERSRSLSSWAMIGPGTRLLTGDRARTVAAAEVGPDWFEVIGVELALGRRFQAADYQAGATPVVMLGRRLWQQRFGQRPDVLGQRLPIAGQPATIIGVLEEDVDHPGPTDLWLPLPASGPSLEASRDVFLVGQLAPGVDRAAAQVELAGLLGRQVSVDELKVPPRRVMLTALGPQVVASALLLFLGGLGTLSLEFLSRALRRRRETAIALALGASPARILWQTLLEGWLLTTAGFLGSLLVCLLLLQPARRLVELPDYATGPAAILPDDLEDVVVYLIMFSLLFVVISLPALVRVTGSGLHRRLRESATTHTGGALGRGLLAALLVGQIALGVGLFVIAGSGLVDLLRARRTEHPLADQVLVLRLPLDTTRLFDDQAVFKTKLLEALARQPGIEAAAILAPNPSEVALVVSDRPQGVRLPAKGVITPVGGDLLRTLDLPLLRGRMLDARDHADAPPVAVIDARFARRFLGDEDPVGRLLWFDQTEPPGTRQIVGVVGSFERFGELPRPTVYFPQQQVDSRALTVLVRTVSDPMALAPMVSAAIHQLQPQQTIEATESLGQAIEDQLHDVGLITALNAGVGLLCLALSILSLYAATATLVAARRRELALRLALGASPARILGMLLPRRLALVTLGTLLGVALAQLALAQAVRSEYGGHEPIGPVPALVAALLVCLPVLLAGVWGPVRRLGLRSPMQDLRHE